jgi:hypothetical protein
MIHALRRREPAPSRVFLPGSVPLEFLLEEGVSPDAMNLCVEPLLLSCDRFELRRHAVAVGLPKSY